MIEVKNITHIFSKKEQPVLSDLSLIIGEKERVVLTGDSGTGKSTLANIIAGYTKPTKGKVLLDGNDMTKKPTHKVMLINQEDDLFPWLTVHDQIALGLRKMKDKRVKEEKIQNVIQMVKLEGSEKKYPHELSGGMKKRTSLARALVVNPKLIILDETFSSLDQTLRIQIMKDLLKVLEDTGTSMLAITHEPNDISIIQGKHLALHTGKLVQI